MLYQLHEIQRAMLSPLTAWAQAASKSFANPASPLAYVPGATRLAAGYELLYRLGKDYEKPEFNLHQIVKGRLQHPIIEQHDHREAVLPVAALQAVRRRQRRRRTTQGRTRGAGLRPRFRGHHSHPCCATPFATLLQDHKVYLTDWVDARMVPLDDGGFSLDDYVAYIQEFIRHIGAKNLHVISVCQPTVPVLAAISLMASRGEETPPHDDDDGWPDRRTQKARRRSTHWPRSTRWGGSKTT